MNAHSRLILYYTSLIIYDHKYDHSLLILQKTGYAKNLTVNSYQIWSGINLIIKCMKAAVLVGPNSSIGSTLKYEENMLRSIHHNNDEGALHRPASCSVFDNCGAAISLYQRVDLVISINLQNSSFSIHTFTYVSANKRDKRSINQSIHNIYMCNEYYITVLQIIFQHLYIL